MYIVLYYDMDTYRCSTGASVGTFFITFPLHIMKHLMRCPVISFITVECRFCVFLLDVTVKSSL